MTQSAIALSLFCILVFEMQEPNYHVPNNPKKPKFEWSFSVILNMLNISFFIVVAALVFGGACGVDREAICRGISWMALLGSSWLAVLLLLYSLLTLTRTSPFMRWFTIGPPLIPILFVAFVYLRALF